MSVANKLKDEVRGRGDVDWQLIGADLDAKGFAVIPTCAPSAVTTGCPTVRTRERALPRIAGDALFTWPFLVASLAILMALPMTSAARFSLGIRAALYI
jgi:hypothetical protein